MMNLDLPTWNDAGRSDLIHAQHQLGKPEILFTKIEDDKIQEQIDKLLQSTEKKSKFPPMKDEITFDDFTKMDIRVGTITAANKIEKADKLLQLTVDTGIDTRTVVSGYSRALQRRRCSGTESFYTFEFSSQKNKGSGIEGDDPDG